MENTYIYLGNNYLLYDEIKKIFEKIEDTENDNKLFYEKINKTLNNIKTPKIREFII